MDSNYVWVLRFGNDPRLMTLSTRDKAFNIAEKYAFDRGAYETYGLAETFFSEAENGFVLLDAHGDLVYEAQRCEIL